VTVRSLPNVKVTEMTHLQPSVQKWIGIKIQ
jgi:hypothetical protein